MAKKVSLSQLNKDLHKDSSNAEVKHNPTASLGVNIPRGERGNFLKCTITLPSQMLSALRIVGMSRKSEGQKDCDVSSLIREAVSVWLTHQ